LAAPWKESEKRFQLFVSRIPSGSQRLLEAKDVHRRAVPLTSMGGPDSVAELESFLAEGG
jgi:hypothetical protein